MKFKYILAKFGFEQPSDNPPTTAAESEPKQAEQSSERELSPAETNFREKMIKFLGKIEGYIQVDGVRKEITGNRTIYGVYVPNEHLPRAVEYFKAKGYYYENEEKPDDAVYPRKDGNFNTNIYAENTLIRIAYKE